MGDSSRLTFPEPVLSQVFLLLSAAERNAVRLTCSLWRQICDTQRIAKFEKLVFYAADDMEDVKKCLKLTTRKILNVEFHLNNLHEIDWKSCGPKIHSLTWHESSSGPWKERISFEDIIFNIINFGTNLQTLTVTYEYKDNAVLSESLVNKLIKKGIVRPAFQGNLGDFSYHIDNRRFVVFPGLKHMFVSRSQPLDSTIVPNLINVPPSMQRIQLGEPPSYTCRQECVLSLNNNIKLKEFIMNVEGSFWNTDYRPLLQLIERQSELEAVRLFIDVSSLSLTSLVLKHIKDVYIVKSDLVVHILNSCPNLKHIDIVFRDTQEHIAEIEEMKNLMAETFSDRISRLSSVRLLHYDFCNLLTTENLSPSLRNNNLRSLRLPASLSNCNRIIEMNLFSLLQCIEIPKCSVEFLKKIANFQTNLITLTIQKLEPEVEFSSPTCFAKLEHLDVTDIDGIMVMFEAFQVPRLKHLTLRDDDFHLSEERINSVRHVCAILSEKAPQITVLQLYLHTSNWISTSKDVEFARQLRRLQFLSIGTYDDTLSKRQIVRIFEMCESLRLFLYGKVFSYNRKCKLLRSRISRRPRYFECGSFEKKSCCQKMFNNIFQNCCDVRV